MGIVSLTPRVFQFLMVQLKGAYYREICNQYKKFQFLMVQLKADR